MNDRQDIDARIDAVLVAQVRAPKLDRQFDAAVWRRIEAEQRQPARASAVPVPGRSGSALRWLRAGNAAGVVVAVVLLAYFGLQAVGGIASDLLAGAAEQMPDSWLTPASWAVTACALAFGLRFTPLGRWLRAEFF